MSPVLVIGDYQRATPKPAWSKRRKSSSPSSSAVEVANRDSASVTHDDGSVGQIGTRAVPLDTLYSLLADADFEKHQEEMDRMLEPFTRGGEKRAGRRAPSATKPRSRRRGAKRSAQG